ncbi:MAG: tetratricopeptide repeat protein [Alphaproteobacteria bacterium]
MPNVIVKHPTMPPKPSLSAALRAFNRNAFDQAATLCRDYLAVRPTDADALHILGVSEFRRGAYESAVEWIGRALEARPGDASMRTNYASALMEADRLD